MNNELLFQSNQPVPFPGARTVINNPELNQIGVIGENKFNSGLNFLNFSKDLLSLQDKSNSEEQTNFNIFMSIMCSVVDDLTEVKQNARLVLSLLFPSCDITFSMKEGIKLHDINTNYDTYITNENYEEFKDILVSMFDMHDVGNNGSGYNPADLRAAKIAEKLQKGKKKIAKQRGEDIENINIFAQYVSILAVGERKDKNVLMKYTVYQIKDEFKRWQLETGFNINLRARFAGATNLEEAENWMEDIHKASK